MSGTSPDYLLWLIIGVVTLCFGGVLLFSGRRGRKVDNHPLCRRCGYDLTGLPAEQERCSECGADLRRSRAVRRGQRETRGLFVAAALVLFLPGLAALVYSGRRAAVEIDWQRHKPVSWLLRESAGADVARRDAAIGELKRRLDQDELPQSQLTKVADRALAHQANLSQAWLLQWGDLIEDAHTRGTLSQAQWKQYALQAATLSLTVRPRIRRGDPVVLSLHLPSARASAKGGVNAVATFDINDVTVNGRRLVSVPRSWLPTRSWLPLTFQAAPVTMPVSTYELETDERTWSALSDGPQQIDCRVSVAVYSQEVRNLIPIPGTPRPEPIGTTELKLSASFTLLPANQSSVELVKDESLANAVKHSIRVGNAALPILYKNGDEVSVDLYPANAPPVGIVCDLFLRSGSQEWPAGQFTCGIGFEGGMGTLRANVAGFSGQKMDIILRPNPSAAAKTISITKIWGNEIILQDVRVQSPRSRRQF